MVNSYSADKLIPQMSDDLEFKKRGVTQDIISVIIWASHRADKYTKDYASTLKIRTINDLYAIWYLVKRHIKYIADQEGEEVIKSPAALWHLRKTKGGDCKSFSIFLKSICSNLGLSGGYRFVSWKPGEEITHVYPYVYWNGQRYFLDAVPGARFNGQARFHSYVDYEWNSKKMIAGITQQKSNSKLFQNVAIVGGITYLLYKATSNNTNGN